VTGDADPVEISRHVTRECGLPRRAVRVRALAELPRLPSGKPDYQAIRDLPRDRTAPTTAGTVVDAITVGTVVDAAAGSARGADGAATTAALCRLYAEILDQSDVTEESSFVSLGGDSLSYVEMSIRLEKSLGHLPANWHTRTIRDLSPASGAPGTRRRLRWVETSVILRAVSIVLVVGTHIGLFNISGGAHLLLGVAGFNFARFNLTTAPRRDRIRHVRDGITRIAVPSVAWVAVALLLTKDYGPANLVLLHSVLGPRESASGWHFWFIEALVYILVAVLAVLAVPAVDRFERRFPYGLPMALLAAGLLTRYDLLGLRDRFHVPSAVVVFWLFALGWAAARAGTVWRRLAVTAAILATVPGFFAATGPGRVGDPQREMIIMVGLTLLVWARGVPSISAVNRVAGILAGSSLYIYLTHWQVFPRVDDYSKSLALLASLAVGVMYAAVVGRATTYLCGPRAAGAAVLRADDPRRPGGLGRRGWQTGRRDRDRQDRDRRRVRPRRRRTGTAAPDPGDLLGAGSGAGGALHRDQHRVARSDRRQRRDVPAWRSGGDDRAGPARLVPDPALHPAPGGGGRPGCPGAQRDRLG
jgi:hypothetical protein